LVENSDDSALQSEAVDEEESMSVAVRILASPEMHDPFRQQNSVQLDWILGVNMVLLAMVLEAKMSAKGPISVKTGSMI